MLLTDVSSTLNLCMHFNQVQYPISGFLASNSKELPGEFWGLLEKSGRSMIASILLANETPPSGSSAAQRGSQSFKKRNSRRRSSRGTASARGRKKACKAPTSEHTRVKVRPELSRPGCSMMWLQLLTPWMCCLLLCRLLAMLLGACCVVAGGLAGS